MYYRKDVVYMTISLRLSNEDFLLIKKYAELKKMSVSELVRQSVMERIEDEYDLKAYQKAMERSKDVKKLPLFGCLTEQSIFSTYLL